VQLTCSSLHPIISHLTIKIIIFPAKGKQQINFIITNIITIYDYQYHAKRLRSAWARKTARKKKRWKAYIDKKFEWS